MDTDGVTLGRLAGVGLGAYVALAGVATLVGMPWQYTGGGAALAALRILGGVLAIGVGAALVWTVATVGGRADVSAKTSGTRRSQ